MPSRSSSGRITLLEIARLAGVSAATVSRVLNRTGQQHFTEKTAERIRAIAAQHGFRPNAAARALRTRRTHRLEILVPNWQALFLSEYLMGLFQGIADQASRQGLGLMVSLVPYETWHAPTGLSQMIQSGDADGHIIAPAPLPAPLPGRPLVYLGFEPEGHGRITYVDCDNRRGAELATRHLIDRGRRRIVHLEGHALSSSARDRKAGYAETMAQAGLRPRSLACGYSVEDGYRATQELIRKSLPCDALFAANDLAAFGARQALIDAGRRVPMDVAVVGFDCLSSGQILSPRLTTVRQPLREMGEEAVKLLHKLIDGQKVKPTIFPVELVVGETT